MYFHTLYFSTSGWAERRVFTALGPKKGHLEEVIAILAVQQNIGLPCGILQPQLDRIPPTDAAAWLGVCIPALCQRT